jgi:hypothetical protein
VTQMGRLPRNTVKLNCCCTPFVGFVARARWKDSDLRAYQNSSKVHPAAQIIFS